jgi:hypothetical protein
MERSSRSRLAVNLPFPAMEKDLSALSFESFSPLYIPTMLRTLFCTALVTAILFLAGGVTYSRALDFRYRPEATAVNHVFWIWFENREDTSITAANAPDFINFANTYANLTNFTGVSHPSQPNYLVAFSGSTQGVTNDAYVTFPVATDNLAKQLAAAGKSWRLYAQGYPGNCSDVDTFAGGVDGPGLAGQYARKHNPAIGFQSVRSDATQCAFIQPLANFDPSVNFAMIVPNMVNDMHDGTTAQGNAFLAAFLPQIINSPDWAHTLLIITFDEGETSISGGGNIYTAAAAPWISHLTVSTPYNHYNVLRTTEQIFGLPFLGGAASAATITEILPPAVAPAGSSVTGRVRTSGGAGIAGARVALRNASGTVLRTALTNSFGYYGFDGLTLGQGYQLTAVAKRYQFSMQAFSSIDGSISVDLVAP